MMTLTYYNILKNKLDKFWFHQPVKFDFNEELPYGNGNRFEYCNESI